MWTATFGTATQTWDSRLWLSFPEQSRRVERSSPPLPLQDSSDAVRRVERCRAMAQKWREGNCRSGFASARCEDEKGKKGKRKIPFPQSLAFSRRSLPLRDCATSSFFAQNLQPPCGLGWQCDCSPLTRAMRIRASSRGSRRGSCSEFRTDSPKRLEMAFCCCKLMLFLYIGATGAAPR
jgi:hypothetical protein